MKRVKLVKLKDEDIMVGDMMEYHEQATMNCAAAVRIHDSYDEYVPEFCYRETMPIRKIVDNGVEHYIAVENKVWEYLYYIENPVTAEAQELKIKKLTESSESWQREAWRTAESYKKFRASTFNASILTRIKWVFTGVKF